MPRPSARLASVLLASSLAALLAPAVSAQKPGSTPKAGEPRAADVAALAQALAAYSEARTSGAGLDEAKAALLLRLDELGQALGGDALQHPVELGRALALARAHPEDPKEKGGKVQSGAFAQGSFAAGGMAYAYRLPREYTPGRAHPLILAIPAEDETPADHIRLHWTTREIQGQAILLSPAMPAERESWEKVMVKGRPGGLAHVLTALRIADERFAVDVDRVYVAGYGKGVPAAIAAGNYSPQRFAGVLGQAGDAGTLGPENFLDLPTYFAGGGAEARAFGAAAKAAGYDNSTFEPEGTEADLWAWMQAHPRQPRPQKVVLVPGDPFPTRSAWLQVSPSAQQCRASAVLERDTNTLRLDSEGMAHATVFLNDALLDLSREVRVIKNGVEESVLVPRQRWAFLDFFFDGTSDPSAVYVARLELELSGTAAAAPESSPEAEAEYAQRLAAAGDDVARLWELHQWCAAGGRVREDGRVLATIVRLDPAHERAHEALGHVRSGATWFTTPAGLERFQHGQDPATAAERGWIEFRSQWMHRDDRAHALEGWRKDPETGQWLTPGDEKRLAEGWARQDTAWVAPAEAWRVDDGQWLVDGEWLDLAHADRRHARLDEMWVIPGAEIQLYSTADRAVALRAQWEMGRALVDLGRVFGAQPLLPLRVCLLRDEEQYDRFAFGDPDGRRLATHAGRLHVVHSAFFAESWFPRPKGKAEFQGMGVAYWDTHAPNGDAYGVHAARLAAGFSYVEALDPSPNAVKKALRSGPGADYYAAYQAEKVLPAWLRWGGAVYAERFFLDAGVAPDADRWWARTWSLENLKSRGGLRPLDQVLSFALDPDEREDGLKLLIEAGLVVAFVVDGECAPVVAEHVALKKALAAGKLGARHVTALGDAVRAHEKELRAFAGY